MYLRALSRCKAFQQCVTRSVKNTHHTVQHSTPVKSIKRSTTTIPLTTATTTTTTTTTTSAVRSQKLVGYWLLGCSGTVAGAVALGGLTRLTKSGLSMTDWHLVKGMKPPRTEDEWMAEFERYKEFPEFKLARRDMTLKEFKFIFRMEYYHRMYGRMVGLAFYIPAGYLWARGYLSAGMKKRALVFGGLILGQGLLGWYMVKSGLNEQTCANTGIRVSQYRLAAHLGMAFAVFSGLFYNGIGLVLKENAIPYTKAVGRLKSASHASLALIFLTALSGAFVAGLDAGLVYNSFPMFADRWIPSDIAAMNPIWKNMFENPTTVQFNHRVLAMTTFSSIVAVACLAHPVALPWRTKCAVNAMLGMACVQVSLGVATLLLYVPTELAATHQMGSLTLLSIALWLNRELKSAKIPK